MIWPFKRKSKSDQTLEIIDDAIDLCRDQWIYFKSKLKFKDNVTLQDEIIMFFVPMSKRLEKEFPILKNVESLQLMIVAKGIISSGSHKKIQVEKALNVTIPR
jgi:hypothetical protein